MIHIPDSLITRILQKKCILFLGAGATKESGGALGSELGKYIYNQIGDIGIDAKNYTNWGWRKNTTRDLVILDDAYIYSTGFKTFRCTNCDAKPILFYDDNYTSLICPECNKVYSFATIRRRISKKDQEEEIGDILTQGYKLTHAREIQELNPNFSIRPEEEAKEKKKKKPVLTLNEPEEDEPELEIDD